MRFTGAQSSQALAYLGDERLTLGIGGVPWLGSPKANEARVSQGADLKTRLPEVNNQKDQRSLRHS